jgi:hypothetical protein
MGEDKHSGLRPPPPHLDRGPQAIISVPRRHLDVGDDHRRAVGESLAQQIFGVAGLSDDFEPGLGEQSRDPLAEQDVVLADHHAQRP